MRDTARLAKETKTFELFIEKLKAFPAWYHKTEEQKFWGKAQWYNFYVSQRGA